MEKEAAKIRLAIPNLILKHLLYIGLFQEYKKVAVSKSAPILKLI